jgi:trk system potassium uptake protein TrkA
MVDSTGYASIARKLGVDVVIPIKTVVVDSILSKLIGGGVKGVHSMGDSTVDILELEIHPGCRAEGHSLKDFHLPEGALVMLVNRKVEEDFIPRGDYIYTAGHTLILMVKNGTEIDIEEIFGKTSSGEM